MQNLSTGSMAKFGQKMNFTFLNEKDGTKALSQQNFTYPICCTLQQTYKFLGQETQWCVISGLLRGRAKLRYWKKKKISIQAFSFQGYVRVLLNDTMCYVPHNHCTPHLSLSLSASLTWYTFRTCPWHRSSPFVGFSRCFETLVDVCGL